VVVADALQVCYVRSKQHGLLPRYWCAGDRGQQMVRNCITFAGTRVDQSVAIEVLEALRPLGVQAAIDALDCTEDSSREADCEVRSVDDRTDTPGASRSAQTDSSSSRGSTSGMGS